MMKYAIYDNPITNERELWINKSVRATTKAMLAKSGVFWVGDDMLRPPFEVNSTFRPNKIWGDPAAIDLTAATRCGRIESKIDEVQR